MDPSSSSARKFKKKNFFTRNPIIIAYFTSLVLCSLILIADAAQNGKIYSNCNNSNGKSPDCATSPLVNRTPKQLKQQDPPPASESLQFIINWLFGPPASAKAQVSRSPAVNSSDLEHFSAKPEPKGEAPVGDKSSTAQVKNTENVSSSPKNVESTAGQKRNEKNIEITDIQASIGTELHSSQLPGDPSQVNLKDELDLVEKFDQAIKQYPQAQLKSDTNGNPRTGRLKREPYKPIKVPYTTTKTNNLNNNLFRQRQLLVNPFEQQQMMALQQQQAAAAAAMLHQQQMDNLLAANGNRYSLLDDYDRDDDDSDSDEDDSDDFEGISPFGPPLIHHHMYLRDGLPSQAPIPPFQKKLGWGLGRRSVADKNKQQQNRKFENGNIERERTGNGNGGRKKINNRASLKNGQWFLDDYDLNSEFYDRPLERKNLPSYLLNKNDRVESPELDEEEHFDKQNKKWKDEEQMGAALRYRGDMDHILRQDASDTENPSSTTEAASGSAATTSDESTTESSGSTTESGGSTTTGGSTTISPGGSTTESGSTTVSSGNTTQGQSTTQGVSTTEGPTSSNTTDGMMGSSNTTVTSTPGSTTVSSGNSSSTTEVPSSTTSSSNTTTQSPKPKPPYTATLNCRCGSQSVRGHEVRHGTVVRSNTNPWLVAISNKTAHMCSGSIINDRYILTSKSCIKNATPGSLRVTPGLATRNTKNFSVTKIIQSKTANIALLHLNSEIKPSSNMRPVCLPIGKRMAGQYSTAKLVTYKKAGSNLQVIDTEVPILGKNNTRCMSTSPNNICAGPPGTMKCGGDTGGILMVYRGGYSYEQIGVVAGTVGCRTTKTPGVYTDLRKTTRWILNNSRDGNYCKSPPVTDEDLSSTTRQGDPNFELNEDFDDDDTSDNENEEEDAGEGEDDPIGEVIDSSSSE